MRDVARLPENDRRDLYRAAAQKMRVHEAIIEKDFLLGSGLRKDCQAMQAMLFGQIPGFDEIVAQL